MDSGGVVSEVADLSLSAYAPIALHPPLLYFTSSSEQTSIETRPITLFLASFIPVLAPVNIFTLFSAKAALAELVFDPADPLPPAAVASSQALASGIRLRIFCILCS